MNKISDFIQRSYVFYTILVFNIILLFIPQFYPSMDGAAHLYNANLLKKLWLGDSFLEQFYNLNTYYIPNYTSHILLAISRLLFPAWLAEKLLLLLYICSVSLSFKYLLNKIAPKNNGLSVLIFPFLYSFLFHLGFYNFCLSFTILFFTIGYWIRVKATDFRFAHYIGFSILFLFAYYTNVLIFAFLGITIGLYVLFSNGLKSNKIETAKVLLKLLLVSMSGLILFVLFYSSVQFFPSNESYTFSELMQWIVNLRSIIVYDYTGEKQLTTPLFLLLMLLLTLTLIKRIKQKLIPSLNDLFLIPTILLFTLLVAVPNGSNAGMMSDRYCLLLFVFLLLWITSTAVNSKDYSLIILSIISLHIGLQFKHLNAAIKPLSRDAVKITEASKFINNNSLVLPINLSDNWLELHFSNYLGIDKSMVILENYEANVNWFPLKWKNDFPQIRLGNKTNINGISWQTNLQSSTTKIIDNVFIYGNQSKLENEKWVELKEVLASNYKLIYQSKGNYIALYQIL